MKLRGKSSSIILRRQGYGKGERWGAWDSIATADADRDKALVRRRAAVLVDSRSSVRAAVGARAEQYGGVRSPHGRGARHRRSARLAGARRLLGRLSAEAVAHHGGVHYRAAAH